jgi:hypothetical protein
MRHRLAFKPGFGPALGVGYDGLSGDRHIAGDQIRTVFGYGHADVGFR